MSNEFAVPSYAPRVWVVGDELIVRYPPHAGDVHYTVSFPMTGKGIEMFLGSMRARRADSVISTRGKPTEWDIETTLRSSKKYKEWLDAMPKKNEMDKWLDMVAAEIDAELKQ